MAQAKTASKNNPVGRQKAREFFYDDKKIVPVMFISENGRYMAAKYDGSDDLVTDRNGSPLPWGKAKN